MLLTISLVGCTPNKSDVVHSEIPKFPEPNFSFISVDKTTTVSDNLNCVDEENTTKLVNWILGIERYKEAVETLRTRK